jgi:hypothetical protein
MDVPRKLTYQATWGSAIGFVVFAIVMVVICAHEAITNDRGLIINGILRFEQPSATKVYWGMTVLSLSLLALFVWMLIDKIGRPLFIEINENGMVVPAGIGLRKLSDIKYEEITNLTELGSGKSRFLLIHFGKSKVSIGAAWLPKGEYDPLKSFLLERIALKS